MLRAGPETLTGHPEALAERAVAEGMSHNQVAARTSQAADLEHACRDVQGMALREESARAMGDSGALALRLAPGPRAASAPGLEVEKQLSVPVDPLQRASLHDSNMIGQN